MFESANRIVVEKPNYGHATYFFDLEEPLPVADQVMPVPHAVQKKAKHSTADAISSKLFFWREREEKPGTAMDCHVVAGAHAPHNADGTFVSVRCQYQMSAVVLVYVP